MYIDIGTQQGYVILNIVRKIKIKVQYLLIS